jgi:hypothetical protein
LAFCVRLRKSIGDSWAAPTVTDSFVHALAWPATCALTNKLVKKWSSSTHEGRTSSLVIVLASFFHCLMINSIEHLGNYDSFLHHVLLLLLLLLLLFFAYQYLRYILYPHLYFFILYHYTDCRRVCSGQKIKILLIYYILSSVVSIFLPCTVYDPQTPCSASINHQTIATWWQLFPNSCHFIAQSFLLQTQKYGTAVWYLVPQKYQYPLGHIVFLRPRARDSFTNLHCWIVVSDNVKDALRVTAAHWSHLYERE